MQGAIVRAWVLAALLVGCGGSQPSDPPPSCSRLSDDLADWIAKPGIMAEPVVSCGRTLAYQVTVPAGQTWTLQRTIPARRGLPVKLRAEMSAGAAVRSLSISDSVRQLSYALATGETVETWAVSDGGDVTLSVNVTAKTMPAAVKVSNVWLWFDQPTPPPY